MPKYINLQIPKSCHQDWQTMLPEDKGRFCAACQKKVIDFTQMSDEQLVQFFKKPSVKLCGRFTPEQINKDLLIPSKKVKWVTYFFSITLPAFLLSLKSSVTMAQNKKERLEILPAQTIKGEVSPSEAIKTSGRLEGIIKGENDQPLPGATVMIKGTRQGTITDADGKFIFNGVSKPITLSVSYVGYETKEVECKHEVKDTTITLNIALMTAMLGEVVVVKSYSKKQKAKMQASIKPAPALTIYPNPSKASMPINLKWTDTQAGSYVMEIFDVTGAIVHTQIIEVKSTTGETIVQLNKPLTGTYYIRFSHQKSGKFLSQQVRFEP